MKDNNRAVVSLGLIIVVLMVVTVYLFLRLVNTPQILTTNDLPSQSEAIGVDNGINDFATENLDSRSQEQIERPQSHNLTTNALFASLIKIDIPWRMLEETTYVDWHRTEEKYQQATSLSFTNNGSMVFFYEDTDLNKINKIGDEIKEVLTEQGYHLDPERDWIYTGSGGAAIDTKIFTNNVDVVLLTEAAYYCYACEAESGLEISNYAIGVTMAGTIGQFQEIENRYNLASLVYAQAPNLEWDQIGRSFTVDSLTRNPYTSSQRYEVVYNTHYGDSPFYYYHVDEDEKIIILADGLIGRVNEDKCRNWLEDPDLDYADKRFLIGQFCPAY